MWIFCPPPPLSKHPGAAPEEIEPLGMPRSHRNSFAVLRLGNSRESEWDLHIDLVVLTGSAWLIRGLHSDVHTRVSTTKCYLGGGGGNFPRVAYTGAGGASWADPSPQKKEKKRKEIQFHLTLLGQILVQIFRLYS